MSKRIDADVETLLRRWFPDLDFGRVRIVERGPVCWYARHVVKQGAMTIAPFIFFGRTKYNPCDARSVALLAHELKHVEQVRRIGRVRFFARYLWALARSRFRYSRELPLEAEAYALQATVLGPIEQAFAERDRQV
jgi:hypothetical protein